MFTITYAGRSPLTMLEKEIIAIRLIPKASSNRIGAIRSLPNGTEQLIVYVTAAPDKGQANDMLISLLAKHLKVSPSSITIVRGSTKRSKLISVLKEVDE